MERRYWSVRDAGWLPCPRPVGALETPWSLHARSCPVRQPLPTADADLRWLAARRVPAPRRPAPERGHVRT